MLQFVATSLVIVCLCSPLLAFDQEYEAYGTILKTYVTDGLVNYADLKKDRKPLDDFIKEAGAVTADEYDSWNRDQQLAFWINMYNAWMMQIVIDHYPIQRGRIIGIIYPAKSVQQISGIWDGIKTQAAGREVTLNEIEHKILRPVFKEPRIHFAIVCASLGCPKLRSEPYRATTLTSQLDESTHNFITDDQKVHLVTERSEIFISKIFHWFEEDFSEFATNEWVEKYDKNEAGALAMIARNLPEHDAEFLQKQTVNVEYLDYDWSLNDQK
jgi:hypothetical protein